MREVDAVGVERWYVWSESQRLRVLHREDGPAVLHPDGAYTWYYMGREHRLDGPADLSDIWEHWYRHGKLHREDGPARVTEHLSTWYRNGELHREDGPAAVRSNGTTHWYLLGIDVVKHPAYITKYFRDDEVGKGMYLLMIEGHRL